MQSCSFWDMLSGDRAVSSNDAAPREKAVTADMEENSSSTEEDHSILRLLITDLEYYFVNWDIGELVIEIATE